MRIDLHRPARFSVHQLGSIAERLRRPLGGHTAALSVLDGRRSRFVEAFDRMATAYEVRCSRTPREPGNTHQAVGRAFREVYRALDALRRLPPSYPDAEVARELLLAHFPDGLGFTQKPMADLTPIANDRVQSMLVDPRTYAIEHDFVCLVHKVRAALERSDAPSEPPPSLNLAALLREANTALHAFARLVEELAGIELEHDQASALLHQVSAPDTEDLSTPIAR